MEMSCLWREPNISYFVCNSVLNLDVNLLVICRSIYLFLQSYHVSLVCLPARGRQYKYYEWCLGFVSIFVKESLQKESGFFYFLFLFFFCQKCSASYTSSCTMQWFMNSFAIFLFAGNIFTQLHCQLSHALLFIRSNKCPDKV